MSEVPPSVAWFYPLTPAQAGAFELVAEGLSNEEIAKRMVRRPTTIDMFVSSGMRQLGLRTRAEVVEWVAKNRPPGSPPARMYRHGVAARSDFLEGLALCPHCHLQLDAQKDVDELIQPVSETRAIGARMTHRRCGTSFEILLYD